MRKLMLALVLALSTPVLSAHAGASTAPCGNVVFGAAPVTTADMSNIIPMGRVHPPEHMIPIRDISFQSKYDEIAKKSISFRVFAPVAADIVAAEYLTNDKNWSIHLKPCKDVSIYYLHVASLAPAIKAKLAASKQLKTEGAQLFFATMSMSAGDLIGGAEGVLIMGVHDFRVPALEFANKSRYAVDMNGVMAALKLPSAYSSQVSLIVPQALYNRCPIAYFASGPKSVLQALLGDNGSAAKDCGTHMQDVKNTAQGNWWTDLNPTNDALFNESDALALLNWNINPAVQLFSLSENTPGLEPKFVSGPAGETLEIKAPYLNNAFSFPVNNGPDPHNRPFAQIKPGQIYCYDRLRVFDGGKPVFGGTKGLNTAVLLAVSSDTPAKLTIEFTQPHRLCENIQTPWKFSQAAKTFYR